MKQLKSGEKIQVQGNRIGCHFKSTSSSSLAGDFSISGWDISNETAGCTDRERDNVIWTLSGQTKTIGDNTYYEMVNDVDDQKIYNAYNELLPSQNLYEVQGEGEDEEFVVWSIVHYLIPVLNETKVMQTSADGGKEITTGDNVMIEDGHALKRNDTDTEWWIVGKSERAIYNDSFTSASKATSDWEGYGKWSCATEMQGWNIVFYVPENVGVGDHIYTVKNREVPQGEITGVSASALSCHLEWSVDGQFFSTVADSEISTGTEANIIVELPKDCYVVGVSEEEIQVDLCW